MGAGRTGGDFPEFFFRGVAIGNLSDNRIMACQGGEPVTLDAKSTPLTGLKNV
jgi:hypothetical protein